MKLVAITVALSLLAGAASASDWRLVSATRLGAIAVDTSSVRTVGRKKVGWTAALFPAIKDGADYIVARYEWDCGEETSTLLALAAYTAEGGLVEESTYRRQTQYLVPDSNEAHIFASVCRDEYLVPDMEGWSSARELLQDYRDAELSG